MADSLACADEVFKGYGASDDAISGISFWLSCSFFLITSFLHFARGCCYRWDKTAILFPPNEKVLFLLFGISLILLSVYLNFWVKWFPSPMTTDAAGEVPKIKLYASSTLLVLMWLLSNAWACFSCVYCSIAPRRGKILLYSSYVSLTTVAVVLSLERILNRRVDIGIFFLAITVFLGFLLIVRSSDLFLLDEDRLDYERSRTKGEKYSTLSAKIVSQLDEAIVESKQGQNKQS